MRSRKTAGRIVKAARLESQGFFTCCRPAVQFAADLIEERVSIGAATLRRARHYRENASEKILILELALVDGEIRAAEGYAAAMTRNMLNGMGGMVWGMGLLSLVVLILVPLAIAALARADRSDKFGIPR